MKALVTGGAGFLGRYLVKELQKSGIETVSYDLENVNYSPGENAESVRHIQGDILDGESLALAMEGCDLVFHTAAIADIDVARTVPVRTMEVNGIGTAKCLEAACNAGVRRFMFASSVYTSGIHGSFYRVSKQVGESLCKTFYEEFGLEYTILRYGSLYGSDSNHWNFVNNVCRELLTKGEFTYLSSPDSVREYIHIQDAARETVRIAQDKDFINKAAMITGHQRMKIEEFFEIIREIINRDIAIHYTPKEKQRHYVMTPYSLEADIPVRVNLSTYIDINEGILGCLREVQKECESDYEIKETNATAGDDNDRNKR
ncbi:MAG: hypothetical protein APR53_03390 [Methanoculleus sp. SDB]|nr:MAG: hypothetical protein APR53_03390 [Methanoculleus sp. SDB]